ncbi:hypothetical protein [Oceanospirillum beijerinckii]|uniref:hypothetical protein n=1 Tax=Oceanospirillum beijerinckii TaxID=64976 RepID=UPI00040444CC|nr:hypothetical protein [Oceanospirillum beijerinckii]
MDELTFLKNLEKKGITFSASYGAESGTSMLSLTTEDALLFSTDPVQEFSNIKPVFSGHIGRKVLKYLCLDT